MHTYMHTSHIYTRTYIYNCMWNESDTGFFLLYIVYILVTYKQKSVCMCMYVCVCTYEYKNMQIHTNSYRIRIRSRIRIRIRDRIRNSLKSRIRIRDRIRKKSFRIHNTGRNRKHWSVPYSSIRLCNQLFPSPLNEFHELPYLLSGVLLPAFPLYLPLQYGQGDLIGLGLGPSIRGRSHHLNWYFLFLSKKTRKVTTRGLPVLSRILSLVRWELFHKGHERVW
jgi:hypothetical protein